MEKRREQLKFLNPNIALVTKELEMLYAEWMQWQKEVNQIVDHPYDLKTQSDVYADGEENMEKHEILQEKTLTFLYNNIRGHGFITGRDGTHCDRTDLRLKYRVKHRIKELRVLRASLKYALVPDSFWKAKGKELVEKIMNKGTEAAIEIATHYLKNPTAIPG